MASRFFLLLSAPALVGACIGLSACSDSSVPPAPAAPAAASPAAPPLFERSRALMGTVFLLKADAPAEVAEPAFQAAFAEIARLEALLSEWRPDSEISRVNAAAGGAPVPVGRDAIVVITAGLDTSRRSGGAFNLSWAALRGLYDFPESHVGRAPDPARVREQLALVRYQDIEVRTAGAAATEGTVRLRRAGMVIGTGAIAKGYALDRVAGILAEAGIESFLAYAGGQVQVRGRRGNRGWRIGIQHPRRGTEYFAFLETESGSVSTSGDYEHYFRDENGRYWHHILDPATGEPARRSVSVTIHAPTGLYADALSTAVFVLGPERGLAMLAEMPFPVEAVILDAECRVHATPGTLEKLRFRIELVNGVLPGC